MLDSRCAHLAITRKLSKRACQYLSIPVPEFDGNINLAVQWKSIELDAILQASASTSPLVAKELLAIRQAAAFVTKNPGLTGYSDEDRRRKAVDTFKSVESYQRIVSRRIRHYRRHPGRQPVMSQLINMMNYDIFKLLGPEPTDHDFRDVREACTFGPGSVGGRARTGKVTDVTPYGKLDPKTVIQFTPRVLPYWNRLFRAGSFRDWLFERKAKVVDQCKGTTVPKDALTDRFIAVEPYLNSYIQLGQMDHLYRRLERWGLTLNDQTRNQELAQRASLPDYSFPFGWATLDLSSASDSVNTELLITLLPKKWFEWYNSTRCDHVRMPDRKSVV